MSDGAQVNGFGEGVAAPPAARRTIPFDYVFRFDGLDNELKGQPGRVHNSTVDISIEAATASCRKWLLSPLACSLWLLSPLACSLSVSNHFSAGLSASLLHRSQRCSTKRSHSNPELLSGGSGRAPPRC